MDERDPEFPAQRGRWQPGQSGNPRGRPPATKTSRDLREAAKALTPKALLTLEKIMDNAKAPAPARVKACEVLMAYGFGRPVNTLSMDDESTAGALIVLWADDPSLDPATAHKVIEHDPNE